MTLPGNIFQTVTKLNWKFTTHHPSLHFLQLDLKLLHLQPAHSGDGRKPSGACRLSKTVNPRIGISKACQGYWCSRTDSAWWHFPKNFSQIHPDFLNKKKKRLKKQHQRQQLLVFPAVASCGPTQRRIPRFQPNHFRSFEIAGALSASPEGRTQRLVGNFIDSSLFKKSRSKVVLLNKKKKI